MSFFSQCESILEAWVYLRAGGGGDLCYSDFPRCDKYLRKQGKLDTVHGCWLCRFRAVAWRGTQWWKGMVGNRSSRQPGSKEGKETTDKKHPSRHSANDLLLPTSHGPSSGHTLHCSPVVHSHSSFGSMFHLGQGPHDPITSQ